MRHLQLAGFAISLAVLGALAGGAEAGAPHSDEPTVTCDQVVRRAARSGAEDGFRVLLGAVAVPGGRHLAHGSTKTADRQWRYYRNAGIAIRAGTSSVSVAVPEGWRDHVAVSWGDSPASSSLRFAPCGGSPAGAWNSYSGGFHLQTRSNCVPLVVRVGGMSTTIRIGVGRACGGSG